MLSTTVERLNALLQSFDECRIQSFDGNRLLIVGCWDLGYHHNFEAEFERVSYLQCATYFQAQTFRFATPQERAQMGLANHTELEDRWFCFESDGARFFIAAQTLEVREGLVAHPQLGE